MTIRFLLGLLTVLCVAAFAFCDDEEITTNEAYDVGYDTGVADACGKHGVRRGVPVPSAYDDSLDEGRLSDAFQGGYWTARNDPSICRR
jgi:hypothetical protein